jgi:hypothetical protein
MNNLSVVLLWGCFLLSSANAQVGTKIADCDKIFGPPQKEFNSANPPTKIFILGELQAQLSHANGTVTGGVYSVADIANGKRQPLSESHLQTIYRWNGFTKESLVSVTFKDFPQLNGTYYKTADAKFIITLDRAKNMLSVVNAIEFMKYLQSKAAK